MYKYATIDIETTGLNRFKDDITFIGIGLANSLDSEKFDKAYTFNMSLPENVLRFKKICKLLKKHKVKTIFQNGKFDTLFIDYHYGIMLPIHHDIMLMGTAYDLAAPHGLKPMAMTYLGVEDWDIAKKEKTSTDPKKVLPYLRKDVLYTWGVFQYFTENLSSKQIRIYKKLLKPAYLMYRSVEKAGIYFDYKEYRKIKKKYREEEKERLDALNKQYDINWNSSQQLGNVLFTKENMPVIKVTPTGNPSCDAGVLKRLAAKGFDLAQEILDYKAINTLTKMFLNRWGVDASYDGRIHPSFNLTNVVSGRTSCSEPNLQQVPRKNDVRSLFTAPDQEGRVFFEADYSQLELRITADYANDKTMIDIYLNGGDIHTETAKTLVGKRKPSKDDRTKAKPVNFGFIYGQMPRGFVNYAFDNYGVTFSLQEATRYRELFFQKYSELLSWHKRMEEECELNGGVANRFGRFRKLPDIYSKDWGKRNGAIRRAVNTPVQGTGSDLLIGAAAQVHKELSPHDVLIAGTIHDSIVGECNFEDKSWVEQEIRRIMIHPDVMDIFGVSFKVPLEVDIGFGAWGSK